ncbi:ninein isoform X2 [Aquarana catesbeiana]|uniref:ninein isoform X2 n=1 Tax=Aquarana catesbeiana TaxID=8400 RepID=UPI003CC92FC2
MEQDQHEARLKELFDSFDTTGTGSLGQEELTDLCHMLQLEEVGPSLQQALLQDNPHGRVHFDQFKEALIDVLSSTLSNKENCPEPDCSLEAQPKYIKDGKRYGRRSMPELQDSLEEFDEETVIEPEDEGTRSSQVSSRNCEEIWKNEGEEYEAEGQLRFWNPDDLNASQTTLSPDQDWVEEKLQLICEDLGITRDGHLHRKKLMSICEQYGFQNLDKEALEDAVQNVDHDETMSLQDFFYEVCKNTKPPTPSSSTPYRQLKRHFSLQPYDESGRRTLTPSAMSGTIGLRLFSKFDDGTGYGCVEDIIDMWHEEGLDNSQAILKALDFSLEGKINIAELTMTLENELLITKNEIYHAALVSFRSEIRHLLERVDQTAREKEKLRLDLEKNEKQKNLMALEVDDHHAAIERRNEYNLKKLDEEYKERTAALKGELRKEREQIFQQANRQRLDLEQELEKVKVEENYLRDRLTLSIKENTRMENELLETTEKLVECETLTAKLQRSLDNILREKFGDLDPSYVEFFRHEEKLLQLRNEYERQRRELQDRIDELQLELEEYRSQGVRGFRSSLKNSLFDEMDNKNSVECDQGIGSEDCPPLNMSIEAEMAIEHMREQHQREVEKLAMELENKTMHYEEKLKEINYSFEKEQEALKEKLDIEIQKAEEQIKIFKMKHLELEADIQNLKEEQKEAEFMHQDQVSRMEAEFTFQKQQLMEKEETLHRQLEEAREMYHKEKEELVQIAEDIEKKAEARLAELRTTYEDKKDQLEQSFQEQMSSFQERHQLETQELRRQLLEQHQQEAEVQRKEMETEFNRRLLEIKSQLAQDLELAEKKYKEDLMSLERQFKNDLQDLLDQQAEERAQWAFEKEELLQEHIDTQERLMEKLEQEKLTCSVLSQGKDALEKSCQELVNNLNSEKENMARELDNLRVRSKQVEDGLTKKVHQLESDLREELTERDEQVCQAQKEVLLFQKMIAELENQHISEKEKLDSRLAMSDALHKEVIEREEKKQLELIEEISRLQKIISNLKAEIKSFSVTHGEYELLRKENSGLKNEVSHLQNNLVLLKDQKLSLEKIHDIQEQTVGERDELLSKLSDLQKKLDLVEKDLIQAREKGDTESKLEFTQAVKSLEIKLLDKDEQLCQAKKDFQETLEKLQKQFELEKDELCSKLSIAEGLYKEVCKRTEEKRSEMMEEITRLQNTINELKDETASFSQIQTEFKFMEKENSELKNALSQLQNSLASLDEERHAYRNLQNVHEQMAKEHIALQSEISRLKKLNLTKKETDKVQEAEKTEDGKESLLSLEKKFKDGSEQLCHTKKPIQSLETTIENMIKDHTAEKQILQAKLSKLEEFYKGLYESTNEKRQEMLLEIDRLQSTIDQLQNEIGSSSKTRQDYMLVIKETEDLKKEVSEIQGNMVEEEERSALMNLQQVHEKTVQENVKLLFEISKLRRLQTGKVMEEDEPASEQLLHDLHEKTEQVFQAEKNVQLLREALQTVEQDRIVERECFQLRQLQSEELYKVVCSEAKKGKEEISRLKGTMEELEGKVASFLKIQHEHQLLQKDNYALKHRVSELQNTSVIVDEGGVFRNLQTAHEQTVKENVRLLAEVSKLQKKLGLLESKTEEGKITDQLDKTKIDDDQTANLQPVRNVEFKMADVAFGEYKKTLDNINMKLQKKTKELEDTTKVLCQLEKGYKDVKTENDHLKTQVVLIQDKLNNLTLEYDQVKKAMSLEEIVLPELEDAPISISGLKLLLVVAKKENMHLQENLKTMELRNLEAIENNRTLLSEVSWLQKEIQNIEEITEASLKLESLYDATKKDNEELKSLVHIMQEKIHVFERKPIMKSLLRNKGIQTDRQVEKRGQNLKLQEHSQQNNFSKPLPQEEMLGNVHICANGVDFDKHPEKPLGLLVQMKKKDLENLESCSQMISQVTTGEDDHLERDLGESSSHHRSLKVKTERNVESKMNDDQKTMEHLRAENITLKEENAELGEQVAALREEEESSNQKMSELLNACEEMWVNLETIQNEKFSLEKMITELKSRNEQLVLENQELFLKNSKNQENLQDLNCRLMMFLKQKDRKDSVKGPEEWQKEKCQMKEEIEGYRTKILDSEQELSQIKVRHRFLEQENTLLRQEIETKELAKSSEITDLKNEISLMKNKNDKLLKEVETLGEELGSCVGKSAKVGYLENKIASLKQEQKTWEQQSNTLRSQLATSQEKIQNLEESLQSVNLQMSRIKSDLRVAQQEKESLKQEVMSLHKQLQNTNAKKQVLEMAIQSSGLQNQQKKQYWDDLEQLMEQEQQLLRQENERLQREVHNTKSDLAQTREKVRQLESTVISLKHQKQGNQSSLVKALEQEKSSLRRECDQLQLELTSANRKISQLSSLEKEMETLKMENEGLRKNQGKFDDHLVQMLHSPTSLSHSHSQLQQQACATVPRDQYLQLQQQFQQAERSNQQLRAALDNRSANGNSPQADQEKLLWKMEARMIDVEQKLRIVKMLLQEKVNQLKEQVTRNSMAETKIKDLFVENSQLLKALELSEQRQQTANKKNYLLEEKISGLSKMVRDLTPNSQGAGHSHQRTA